MKKTIILLIVTLFVLSACSSNLALESEGSVDIDLLPGNETESDSQSGTQTSQENQVLRNPVVIGLLVMLVIVLIALIFMRSK